MYKLSTCVVIAVCCAGCVSEDHDDLEKAVREPMEQAEDEVNQATRERLEALENADES